jgi:enterochelin esterase-like enzyme
MRSGVAIGLVAARPPTMTDHLLHVLGPFDIPAIGPRRVRVYAPPMKRLPEPRPVLYVFDGQNLFDDAPSFAGGWHLHKTAHNLARTTGSAPVIVGIDHGGVERVNELGPWPTKQGGGRTHALLDWMATTLMPRMQADFHVAREPARVGVGGSSLGGLAALHAHFTRPELFGLVLSMSPSLWFAQGKIFELVAASNRPWASRIYLDAGGREGRGMFESAERLAALLRAKGWDEHALRWVPVKTGQHSERSWRRRTPAALRFLFGNGAPSPRRKKGR